MSHQDDARRYAFEGLLGLAGGPFTMRLVTGTPGETRPPDAGSADKHMIYLLNCRECDEQSGRELVIPFGSPAERGKYASEHTRGTGHDRWFVRDERRPVVAGAVVTDAGELEAGPA